MLRLKFWIGVVVKATAQVPSELLAGGSVVVLEPRADSRPPGKLQRLPSESRFDTPRRRQAGPFLELGPENTPGGGAAGPPIGRPGP